MNTPVTSMNIDNGVKTVDTSDHHVDSQTNFSQNKSHSTLDELLAVSNIFHRLRINNQNISYSKSFVPKVSFSLKNNWGKDVDLFILTIEFTNGSQVIEKTINKTIKAWESSEINFTMNKSGEISNIKMTKIHYSDGSIFTEENSRQSK
ncbi:hypothetical protein BH09BAC5_BH09BAC5_03200 [soil metagenome]